MSFRVISMHEPSVCKKRYADDDNAFLNVPEDYEADEQYIRQSQDSSTINCRGRGVLETCTALNLRILNGRIVGHLDGKKTALLTTS